MLAGLLEDHLACLRTAELSRPDIRHMHSVHSPWKHPDRVSAKEHKSEKPLHPRAHFLRCVCQVASTVAHIAHCQ
jgi:hypothetical protein